MGVKVWRAGRSRASLSLSLSLSLLWDPPPPRGYSSQNYQTQLSQLNKIVWRLCSRDSTPKYIAEYFDMAPDHLRVCPTASVCWCCRLVLECNILGNFETVRFGPSLWCKKLRRCCNRLRNLFALWSACFFVVVVGGGGSGGWSMACTPPWKTRLHSNMVMSRGLWLHPLAVQPSLTAV